MLYNTITAVHQNNKIQIDEVSIYTSDNTYVR